jgi:hypothetical protein
MTLFAMQIACRCKRANDYPSGMVCNRKWDGKDSADGFVAGRRYVWECLACGHTICVNMKEVDEFKELEHDELIE